MKGEASTWNPESQKSNPKPSTPIPEQEATRRLCRLPGYPKPYTPNPTPTPYTLHPRPYTLLPAPYTLHPESYTMNPTPYTLHPKPYTLNPTP